jgi:uncharacterized protein YigE (DUF2233 family)
MRKLLPVLTLVSTFCATVLADFEFGPANSMKVDGVSYQVIETTPDRIRILWKDAKDTQLRTFLAADSYLKSQGEYPYFFMNGGIFDVGGVPCGLMIQNGKKLRPLNLDEGEGNFFLKPNGVFLITKEGARIIDASEYVSDKGVRYAIQSGPLLLKNGQTHPVFRKESTSRLHRNGVGVRKDGRIILAITDINSKKFPTLYEFADFFRQQGCQNALFLDGDISQMRHSGDVSKPSNQFASIIAIVAD